MADPPAIENKVFQAPASALIQDAVDKLNQRWLASAIFPRAVGEFTSLDLILLSAVATIGFETKLFKIGSWVILRLPESASAELPSRGQVIVNGTINDLPFQASLEPDGKWSHWFRVHKSMLEGANAAAGDTVRLEIEPTKDWPEPVVPANLRSALAATPEAHALWRRITPMARWEWIRWIRATNQQQTRKRRIEVACSKLMAGERRPCCWNRNLCTEPSVSKNGVLIEPTQMME